MTEQINTQQDDFLRPPKKKVQKKLLFIPAILAVLIISALIFTFLIPRGNQDIALTSNDYAVAEIGELSQSISLTGTVEAQRTVILTTTLTTKATDVYTSVGSRVNNGDVIVSLDTRDAERELNARSAQADNAKRQSLLAAQQAQQAYDQANQGESAEVRSAEAAARSATDAYISAQADLNRVLRHKANGTDGTLGAAQNQLDAARNNLLISALEVVQTGAGNIEQVKAIIEGDRSVNSLVTTLTVGTSLWKLSESQKAVDKAQKLLDSSAIDSDDEIKALQRRVDMAYQAQLDAEFGLEQAKITSRNTIENLRLQAENAWLSAQDPSAEASLDTLRIQIADKDIRAPFNGIITALNASAGNPVTGNVATIADDSTLIVKTSIKEADFSRVHEGAKVTFTSVIAPGKTFTGRVSKKISVPEVKLPDSSTNVSSLLSSSSSSSSTRTEYPIEIEVTGDREGLNLGASAKLRVTTQEINNALVIPTDSIAGEEGDKYVFVLTDEGTVERRAVETGFGTTVNTEITGGELKTGEKVLLQPSRYSDGQQVTVQQ